MRTIKKIVLIFIFVVLIGWLCNILAALIPNSFIHNNILESIDTFKTEGPFKPVIGTKYNNSIADNNTDAWMLLMADYNGPENFLKKSVAGYYQSYENTSQTGSWAFDLLVSSQESDADENATYTYSRYWHGWMLPLKLLLMFTSYEDIRYIGMVSVLLLLFLCLQFIMQKNLKLYALAFGSSVLFMLPLTAMISFEYSFILYITLTGNALLLKYYDKFHAKSDIPVFFLVIGMMTSYFDFLTYPPVTFGFCFATLLFLKLTEINYTPIRGVIDFILNGIFWALGYAGMWVSKWLIGTAVLQTNVISDAMNQLELRTSQTDGISELSQNSITYFQALKNNLEVFQTRGYLFITLFFIAVFCYLIIKNKKVLHAADNRKNFLQFIPVFGLIAAIPFAWVFVLKNHTYLHRNFTSNLFSLCFLAFFSYLAYVAAYREKS